MGGYLALQSSFVAYFHRPVLVRNLIVLVLAAIGLVMITVAPEGFQYLPWARISLPPLLVRLIGVAGLSVLTWFLPQLIMLSLRRRAPAIELNAEGITNHTAWGPRRASRRARWSSVLRIARKRRLGQEVLVVSIVARRRPMLIVLSTITPLDRDRLEHQIAGRLHSGEV